MIFLICDVQLCFAGWGSLVNFDTEEHEAEDGKEVLMAKIARLADEWKIIYDFKPTGYQEFEYDFSGCISLWMDTSPSDSDDYCSLEISFSRLGVHLDDTHDVLILSDQLPKLHEWTRVEISHVEEGGKYFLSLSVGGKGYSLLYFLITLISRVYQKTLFSKINYVQPTKHQPGG